MRVVEGGPVGAIFDFNSNGKMSMSAGEKVVSEGDYSLGSGDSVTLSNIKPPLDGKSEGQEKITITGDTMVIATKNGTPTKLTRVVVGAPAPNKR